MQNHKINKVQILLRMCKDYLNTRNGRLISRVLFGHLFVLFIVFLLFTFKKETKQSKNIILMNVSLKQIPPEKKAETKQKKKIIVEKKKKKKTLKKKIHKKKKTLKKKILKKKKIFKKKISKKKKTLKKKIPKKETIKKHIVDKQEKKQRENSNKRKIQKKIMMEAAKKQIRMISNKAQKNYLSKIQSILYNQWHQPTVGELQYLDDYADIKLTVNKHGKIISAVLARNSADQAMNNSLKLLIGELRKLPPFPASLKKEIVTEIFRFRVEND